jgi:hypothetical protein
MNSGKIIRRSGTSLLLLFAAVLIGGAGCRLSLPERKIDIRAHPPKDAVATQNQVRLRMRSLVDPMCGELEQAADAIIAGTTNRAVQRAALDWEIEGVPALREALFQPDPFTAVMDTWVLCWQMTDYFEKGPGKEALGPAGAQAAATCRRLEEEFTRVVTAAVITRNVPKARDFARNWAAEHPVRLSIANRESTLSRAIERDIVDSFSTGEAVAEITTTLDDLNRRLEIYSDQLLRQARWEMQRFKLELMSDLSVDRAVPLAEKAVQSAAQATATVERLSPAIERAARVAADAPQLVAAEREAAIRALQDELTRGLQSLHEERLAALKEFHAAMAEERLALTRDMEQISLKAADHAMARMERLVAVAMAAGILAAFLGLFVVRRLFFRRPPDIRPESPPKTGSI